MAERFQHIVLFRFPRELSPGEEAEMFAMVRRWGEEIPGFTGLRFGRDVSGKSGGHQYGLLTEFESREAMDAYVPHPAHQEFSRWVFDRGCEVLRMDYALNADTDLLPG